MQCVTHTSMTTFTALLLRLNQCYSNAGGEFQLLIGEQERANLVDVQLAQFFYPRTGEATYRICSFSVCSQLMASEHPRANMESVDGTTPSTVVTQPVIARYVRLSASPCRLSRAHASVHAAGGQRVHAGCRSCVGKRCIVSALTRCVANINQDNRRFLRLSSDSWIAPARQKCTALH